MLMLAPMLWGRVDRRMPTLYATIDNAQKRLDASMVCELSKKETRVFYGGSGPRFPETRP